MSKAGQKKRQYLCTLAPSDYAAVVLGGSHQLGGRMSNHVSYGVMSDGINNHVG